MKDFFKVLKDRSKRNEIPEKEYEFSYKYCNKYLLTTQIIQPKFEPNDIIYLFFEFSEKDDYNQVKMLIGPIFSDKIKYDKNLKSIYKDVLAKIGQLIKPDILEICKICCIKLYLEITKELTTNTNSNLNEEELDKQKYDELLSYFENDWKNEKDAINRDKKEEISKAITNVMNLAKNFNVIITQSNEEEEKNNFDDVKIFVKENNKRINVEELITEKINPSFKFYMIKNIKVVGELINTGLKEEDISNLFRPGKETNYIPFWVFLIRNMSSLNCVYYENKKNNSLDVYGKIAKEIKSKIANLILDTNKINSLENYWINLILDEVPNVINTPNVHLFHSFFNNLFDKLRVNNVKLKNIIQELILNNFYELFDVALNGKQIESILEDDVYKSSNNLIKLLNSPKDFIKNTIIEDFSNKFIKIGEENENLER